MQTYDMQPEEFYIEDKQTDDNGNTTYTLIPIQGEQACRSCGSINIIKHGVYNRKVRDLPSFKSNVGLIIKGNRYLCKDCGNSWVNVYESIDVNSKTTIRLRNYIRDRSLSVPFTNIQDELSISDTTVRNIFDDYIAELEEQHERYAPSVLGIDENHLMNQYRAVFVDVEKRTLIDMLPNRAKKDVKAYISGLPDYDTAIQVVTMDMWKPYKEAVDEVIPDAVVVLDHFHLIKEVNNVLEDIRVSLNKTIDSKDRRYLRNGRFLLLSSKEKLTKEKTTRLREIFERFPQFARPYHMKEMIRKIYEQPTREEAESWYKNIKVIMSEYEATDSSLSGFESVFSMIDNWYDEIFNYFDYKYTNAITENINKAINDIADKGRGYSFKVLRAKAIFRQYSSKPVKFEYADID